MEVPYYLRPDVEPKGSSDLVFNIPISTTPVPSLNNMGSDMESLWERLSNGAESVVDNIKVGVSETYQDVTGFIKSEISDVGNVALGGVEKVFDSLGKYFLIGIGALIILVYVAGKSGAVKIRSVL